MAREVRENLVRAVFSDDPAHGPVCTLTLTKDTSGSPINESVTERVNERHLATYPAEWARFQMSRTSVRPRGMALDERFGMDPDLASLFVAHGVADVETFATLSDARIYRIMPGNPIAGVNLRNRAMLMVPPERRTPLPIDALAAEAAEAAAVKARLQTMSNAMPTNAADDVEALKRQLADSQRRETEALALVNAMTPVPAVAVPVEPLAADDLADALADGDEPMRRGPGRPRKVAA